MSAHRQCCCDEEAACCFVGTFPSAIGLPSCVNRDFNLGLRFLLDVDHRETGFQQDTLNGFDSTLDLHFTGAIQFEVFNVAGDCDLRVISNNVSGVGTFPSRNNLNSPWLQLTYNQTGSFSNYWAWQPGDIVPWLTKSGLGGLGYNVFTLSRYVGARHSQFAGCPSAVQGNCLWSPSLPFHTSNWTKTVWNGLVGGGNRHAEWAAINQQACSGTFLSSGTAEVEFSYAKSATSVVSSMTATQVAPTNDFYEGWCRHDTTLSFTVQTDCSVSSGGGGKGGGGGPLSHPGHAFRNASPEEAASVIAAGRSMGTGQQLTNEQRRAMPEHVWGGRGCCD